jgi:hypothetical protein
VPWILFLSHRFEAATGQLRSVLAASGRDGEAVPVLEKVVAA